MNIGTGRRLVQSAIGAAIGFVLGLAAGLPLGLVGLPAPLFGMAIGAAVAGTLSAREGAAFLAGYLVCGVAAFLITLQSLRAQMGAPADGDALSIGYLVSADLAATGAALTGGFVAAFSCALFSPGRAAAAGRVLLLAVPVLAVAAAVLWFGREITGQWLRYEQRREGSLRAAVDAEKRYKEVLRAMPGLPQRPGPFLYPARRDMRGDDMRLLITTADAPTTVADYYQRSLRARLAAGQDTLTGQMAWTGAFPYEGRQIGLRIARGKGLTNIWLTAQ